VRQLNRTTRAAMETDSLLQSSRLPAALHLSLAVNPPIDTSGHVFRPAQTGDTTKDSGSGRAFRVGEWLVEPRLYRLTRGDSVVDIEPKIMLVLVRLARSPGEVVERETLLDEVWEGTVVTGHVLNRSISKLRKALGDDTDDPMYIETIPKSGYRLIAPVRPVDAGTDEPRGDGILSETLPEAAAGLRISAARREPAEHPVWWRIDRRIVLAAALVVVLAASVSFLVLASTRTAGDSGSIPSIRPITSDPGSELAPSFSPEGDRIAYVGDGTDGRLDVFVKLIDSGDPVQMTKTEESERAPAWSPDGTRLAFIRVSGEDCQLVVMPALGGNERNIAECGIRTHPSLAWTSDGTGLISSERETVDSPFRLWHTSLETLERRPLTDPPRIAFGDVDPAVSADGQTLAFVRGTSQWTKDIYRVPLFGDDAPEQISSFKRDVQGLDWMDANRLVFAANLSGQYGLWTISPSGESLAPVPTSGGWTLRNPAAATSSGRLSYEASSYNPDVLRMSFRPQEGGVVHSASLSGNPVAVTGGESTAPETFIRSSRWDIYAGYSPDGRSVAFVSTRSGSFEVWLAEADGSNSRQLTELEAAWIGMPYWSPDGESILFDANLDGQLELFVVKLANHSVDQLTDNPGHDLASGWSSDGRSVYFASEQTGAWQMWKISVEDRSSQQLTEEGAYRALESADGATLYFHRLHESGLWAVPTAGGEERLVLEDKDPRYWRAWTLDGDDLFYLDYDENSASYQLGTTSLADGMSTTLHWLEGNPGYFGVAISPDRQWILTTGSTESQSDLMLLEEGDWQE